MRDNNTAEALKR